jgi:glycosyltransferase involved in cell wall biosynthesis
MQQIIEHKQAIAYLHVEIPSISTTFVYNEILGLEKYDFKVVPIALHYSTLENMTPELAALAQRVSILYEKGFKQFYSLLSANLISALRKPGRYIKTLLILFKDTLSVGRIDVDILRLLYHFLCANRVSNILLDRNCCHLHAHFAGSTTQIAMYASLLSGVPYSFTSHAIDLYTGFILMKEKVDRAKAAVTISECNKQYLIDAGVDAQKIQVVRCGVKVNDYHFTPKENLRSIPKIGTLSRLVEKKGTDILIQALGILRKEGIKFTFEIVGDGPEKDNLSKMVTQENLDDITIFRGLMPNHEVFDWLRSIDVFVLACRKAKNGDQDGIPVVLMEAMLVGTPVISTKISGIPELIEEKVSGLLAEPTDPTSLADQIRYLIQHPDLSFSLTEKARLRVEHEFGEELNIQRLTEVFCK